MSPSAPTDGLRQCVRIETDSPFLELLLAGDCPEGVEVLMQPPFMRRQTGLPENRRGRFLVEVDLDRITGPCFAKWLIRRVLAVRGRHRLRVGRNTVALRGPGAEKKIAKILSRHRARRRKNSPRPARYIRPPAW